MPRLRIVLSGYQEADLIRGSTHAAHRFLSKPCEPGLLLQVASVSVPPSRQGPP